MKKQIFTQQFLNNMSNESIWDFVDLQIFNDHKR